MVSSYHWTINSINKFRDFTHLVHSQQIHQPNIKKGKLFYNRRVRMEYFKSQNYYEKTIFEILALLDTNLSQSLLQKIYVRLQKQNKTWPGFCKSAKEPKILFCLR